MVEGVARVGADGVRGVPQGPQRQDAVARAARRGAILAVSWSPRVLFVIPPLGPT